MANEKQPNGETPAAMTTAAAIHNDAPTDEDELGRHHLVAALERVARSAETPLVIAVYGSWGSGKTSLMKQLRRRLKGRWCRR